MPDQFPAQERLTLRSRLADVAQVVPWVQALAARYQLSERTAFAIDLCLEEALSNIVRHGYGSDPNRTIEIEFRAGGENDLCFVIEDAAPHFRPFDPAAPPHLPTPGALEEMVPGGLGIPLMRKYADAVAWEPLEHGNRLTFRFSRS